MWWVRSAVSIKITFCCGEFVYIRLPRTSTPRAIFVRSSARGLAHRDAALIVGGRGAGRAGARGERRACAIEVLAAELAPLRQAVAAPARPMVPEPLVRPQLSGDIVKAVAPKEPVRNDPIAELIAPPKRLAAVQRTLAEFGYGQIKPNGQFGPDTEQAIAKFERQHKMPVTGQMSERLVKALATMTGRALD